MTWAVGFVEEFKVEFDTFSELVQDELLLNARLLEEFGRNAILLVAGDKSGTSSARFYKRLIEKADRRYKAHLQRTGE